jgi:excisionase family DNA binding protein
MSVEEAARLLGISRSFAYDAVHSGDLPAIRIGRRWLVKAEALRRMVGDDA